MTLSTHSSSSGLYFFPNYTHSFVHPGLFIPSNVIERAESEFFTALCQEVLQKTPSLAGDDTEILRQASILLRDRAVIPLDLSSKAIRIDDRVHHENAKTFISQSLRKNGPILKKWTKDQFHEFFRGLNQTLLGPEHPKLTPPGKYRENDLIINRNSAGVNFTDVAEFSAYLKDNDPESFATYQDLMKNKWDAIQIDLLTKSYKKILEDSHLSADEKSLLEKYIHIPMRASLIEANIERFIDQLTRGIASCKDDFELAAYAHISLVMIHPFRDGNGRLARDLMNLILNLNGIKPIFFPSHQDYTDAVKEGLKNYKTFAKYLKERLKDVEEDKNPKVTEVKALAKSLEKIWNGLDLANKKQIKETLSEAQIVIENL